MTRRAFSLCELLVVLGLVCVVLGVGAPALLRAQAEANQRQSHQNLKQLGLACHNYYGTNEHFPPGNDANNISAAAYLLPYIEQDTLYKKIDFKKPCTDPANETARKTAVRLFLSPNDPQKVVDGPTNYLFNAGGKPLLADNDGIFYQESKVRFAQITDGTSNTLLAGETLRGDGGARAVDVHRQYVRLSEKVAEKGVSDDLVAGKWKANEDIAGDRCARWIDGRFLQSTFIGGGRAADDADPDVSFGSLGGAAGLRSMDGTINIGICDGSTRTVRVKINKNVWHDLCTRDGGEVLPEF